MEREIRDFLTDRFGFRSLEPIRRGWSADEKLCAVRQDGSKALVRLSDAAKAERKRAEFSVMQQAEALGIPMCRPLAFGVFGDFVYSVHIWIDGTDAETVIGDLSDTEQYEYGLEAGRHLKAIHSIPAPETQAPWPERFNQKLDRKIAAYRACPIPFDGAERMIAYVEENRHLLEGRPQTLQHGDYHISNMMLDADGKLWIIDFDRFDYGDPWEEFNRITWSASRSPFFAAGIINGYFGGKVPERFWRLLALYISGNTLGSVSWAIPFGQKEVEAQLRAAREVLGWYEDMTRVVPAWYPGVPYLQETDGVQYRLSEPYDFSFLHQFGRVFKIFDDQDSGNICFGLERGGERYFLKFAGAHTARYEGDPAAAVTALKASAAIYRALAHENLIRLIEAGEMGGGYGMLFAWTDAICMGRMYPQQHKAFMALPVETRMQVFSDVVRFHIHVAERGYVAVDFYDGSVMYDRENRQTILCDIDFYRKTPTKNDMGRMWGSTRFMSPEEFELGAPLDEVTTVYAMGAMAFALFADCSRTEEAWTLSEPLYRVAEKAVQDDRGRRYPTLRALLADWENACETEVKSGRSL
ncbi:MAG: phosphotransferase [Hominenteromicrobium sp.]